MTSQVSNRAVANKNNYVKSIARYLFENVNCSSKHQIVVDWDAI